MPTLSIAALAAILSIAAGGLAANELLGGQARDNDALFSPAE